MDKVRILVVDDHPIFAEAIATRLASEPDMVVTATAEGTDRALRLIEGEQPSLLLVDFTLGRENGLNLLRAVRRKNPSIDVVMLSARCEPPDVVEALRCGARGWIPKSVGSAELIRIIRIIAGGGLWVPESCLGPVLSELIANPHHTTDVLDVLTARERQILQCTLDGASRAEVAARLFLSPNTVRTHTQNLLAKLECHSMLEAVALARRTGMRPSSSASASQ